MDWAELLGEEEARRLWAAARRGGREGGRASEALLEAYAPIVEAAARRAAWRPEELDDLRQEARLGVLGAISSWEPGRSPLWAWAARRARWACSAWRARRRAWERAARPLEAAGGDPPSREEGPEEAFMRRLDEAAVAAALRRLGEVAEVREGRGARAAVWHPAVLAKMRAAAFEAMGGAGRA